MRKAFFILLCLLLTLCSLSVAQAAEEEENIIYNGDFAIRSEEDQLPDGWYYDAWIEKNSEYYAAYTEDSGVVVLNNLFNNDARICQNVYVEPETYYKFSCEIYTEGILGDGGAHISVLDTFSSSEPLYDTAGWQKAEFVGQTGPDQTELVLALRIGGYGALSEGEAQFRNVSMVRMQSIPSSALPLKTVTYSGGDEQPDAPNWAGIILAAVLCGVIGLAVQKRGIMQPGIAQSGRIIERGQFVLVVLLAFIFRAILSFVFVGHSTDINCFMAWANAMQEYGPSDFYVSGMFADYPPGYMYVLWLIGGLRALFGLAYGSPLFILMVKMPSIIADMVSAYIVYRLAKKAGLTDSKTFLLFCVVALSPAFAFISGGWGQIDSLLTLCLVGVIWFFTTKRRILAGVLFGIAILLKPQALMVGPLLAIAYFTPSQGEKIGKMIRDALLSVLSACAVIVLLSLPFTAGQHPSWLLEKYFSTASSYPFASVEAFNLFALLGANWKAIETVPFLFSYGTWGIIGIFISVAASALLYVRAYREKQPGAPYLAIAYILIALFTLGPYMHERYLFPALLLLLIAGIYYQDRRLYACFIWFSISMLFNALCAFYIVDHQEARGALYSGLTGIGSLMTVLGFGYLTYVSYAIVWKGRIKIAALHTTREQKPVLQGEEQPVEECKPEKFDVLSIRPADRKLRFSKKDKLYCIGLTLLYAIFAVTNLGSLSAPQNEYVSEAAGTSVRVAFDKEAELAECWVFGGIAEGTLLLQGEDGTQVAYEQVYDDMFRWKPVKTDMSTQVVTIMNDAGELRLRELAFFDKEGRLLQASAVDMDAQPLIDEQNTVPERPSYYNGMYFDELYHGRTAYEHLHGLDPYENSHPPLGKVLIMLGIAVFGMNAFGWRIVGALFGAAMVPVFYAFGKRLFKNSEYALLCSVLFAFDFMHFTQTRIATIDVYAVFFIVLMYYYMYQYYSMNFYVDGLKATLKPLALAGVFFALGAASKWICIYAGVGLAALLLLSLFRRYREYQYAKTKGDAASKALVQAFSKNVCKTALWCCLFFLVVPVGVYLLSYIPYCLSEAKYSLSDIWGNQEFMWSYHSTLTATHPYQSAWWQWPFTFRPMWYYMSESMPADMISTMTASGNPAVWWACSIGGASFFVLRICNKIKAEPGMAIAIVGVLANFLPWVLVTRCTFIYHFFATVPFLILCSVYVLRYIENKYANLHWLKWVWMGVCVGLFLLLYPVISGLEIPLWYAQILKWLPGGNLLYGA